MPILRIYGWNPPALSIGRFQKASDDIDIKRCNADRLDVVRRITGGGAIFHADELTYSLVCSPEQIPGAKSVKESFRSLTSFLISFYNALGLNACHAVDLMPEGTGFGHRTPLCFAGRESYDIVINGRKIGGNAQRRSRRVIFQHGSIPLRQRVASAIDYLTVKPDAVEQTTTALQSEGVMLSDESLRQMLKEEFSRCMGVVLKPDMLTEQEERLYMVLAESKYNSNCWNLDGDNDEYTT